MKPEILVNLFSQLETSTLWFSICRCHCCAYKCARDLVGPLFLPKKLSKSKLHLAATNKTSLHPLLSFLLCPVLAQLIGIHSLSR